MSNEWFTPLRYIQAVREVFGGPIDLDPASCELANQTVRAAHYYSKKDNGLEQEWHGRVWLNPPFGRIQTPGRKMNQGLWICKLLQEYHQGNVEQAVLLTTCRPDTSWFEQLWQFPICFANHKVGFYTPEAGQILQEVSHAHGTLFVYLGPNDQRFIDVFSRFGRIARSVTIERAMPAPASLWTGEERAG